MTVWGDYSLEPGLEVIYTVTGTPATQLLSDRFTLTGDTDLISLDSKIFVTNLCNLESTYLLNYKILRKNFKLIKITLAQFPLEKRTIYLKMIKVIDLLRKVQKNPFCLWELGYYE